MTQLKDYVFPKDYEKSPARERLLILVNEFGLGNLNWFKALDDFKDEHMSVIAHPSVEMINLGKPTYQNYYVTDDSFVTCKARLVGFDDLYCFQTITQMMRTMLYTKIKPRFSPNVFDNEQQSVYPIFIDQEAFKNNFKNGRPNDVDELYYGFEDSKDAYSNVWENDALPDDATHYVWYRYK